MKKLFLLLSVAISSINIMLNSYHIEYKLPNEKIRLKLIKYFLYNFIKKEINGVKEEDILLLASKTDHFSCADIAHLIEKSATYATKNKRGITKEDLMKALESLKNKNKTFSNPPPKYL